jgi:DNA topoisomerase I
MTILFIVESPNKIKKIQGFLGPIYNVKASVGHIRDLDPTELSIKEDDNFEPIYSISPTKKKVVTELRKAYKNADKIILAMDDDREGESIAWHVAECLGIPQSKRIRARFTEITKTAIQKSIQEEGKMDQNMFYAQQARRVIDRLLGYKITPVLWRELSSSYQKNKSLSAGRVQSVVNHLIIQREREIIKFDGNHIYLTSAKFKPNNSGFESTKFHLLTKYSEDLEEEDHVITHLKKEKKATFQVDSTNKNEKKTNPPPPFITSTLQQDASIRFNMSPTTTMMTAQKLYEVGLITYMRTDSTLLSQQAKDMIKDKITKKWGEEKYVDRSWGKNAKNAQEAHEAIRPTDCNRENINLESLGVNEKKLYHLIWQRTIASAMPMWIQEVHTITIKSNSSKGVYASNLFKTIQQGWKDVYQEVSEEELEKQAECNEKQLELFKKGYKVKLININTEEKKQNPPHPRYSEASLVKKLDNLGIGRPSTFSQMISIVQTRNYAKRGNVEGISITLKTYSITPKTNLITSTKEQQWGAEKNKLIPLGLGKTVGEYLEREFPLLIDVSLTTDLEKGLDEIASGKMVWHIFVKAIYDKFVPRIELGMSRPTVRSTELVEQGRELGEWNGKKIIARMGKYGPIVSLISKEPNSKEKPIFAPLKTKTVDEITFEEAKELLAYPRILGKWNNSEVKLCKGQYGIYLTWKKINVSLRPEEDDISIEDAISYLEDKKTSADAERKIGDYIVKHGPYGTYLNWKGKKNISLPKNIDIEKITVEECDVLREKAYQIKSTYNKYNKKNS